MAERRSIGDAMTMTPAKLAFIHGDPAPAKKEMTKEGPGPVVEKTIDVKSADEESKRTKSPPSRRKERSIHEPDANERLNQVLVPHPLRLQHRTSQALKRASLELRLRGASLSTQQQIAEEALSEWLTKEGFLD